MDEFFNTSSGAVPAGPRSEPRAPDPDAVSAIARLLGEARRPVLILGTDVWADGAEVAALRLVETLGLPTITNGMGRGLVPGGHPLLVTKARGQALGTSDLVVVVGTPLDFRLGYGVFGGKDGSTPARVVHLADSPGQVSGHAELAGSASGDLTTVLDALLAAVDALGTRPDWDAWVGDLQASVQVAVGRDATLLSAEADPIHPARIYGELVPRLADDAVVIGDGGDFVSYMGKYVDTYTPGCFLGPGPYGCLGSGTGYALAAALAHPDRQVVVCYGDGAIGFTLGDLDTLVRHEVNVTAVIGNNGIWGLEKHPMQMIFGYDVVAELRPGTRYDRVAEALGGHGELVEAPGDIGPALDRAFAHDGLSVVNVLTDPADAYPRSSNLG
jgi:acetolactate synthase-1/2/3 large subunit